jgi:class 3 adenylate cyclase/tetratricopeptide (TPR) repeat protein
MRCSNCGQANPADARFCLECGAEVGTACRHCGRAIPIEAKFCPGCGQAAAAAPAPASYTPRHLQERILADRASLVGERKQVTVVFCDIVRSSALAAELGAEAYHRTVDEFFSTALSEVHRYEGTINQFLGDGFMALFGAPLAHEDHFRRALLAALGIVERSHLDVRIGAHSGPVVVGAIGDDLRMDYTAFGDTTIVAARLQAAAEPGEVLVSRETAALVDGWFRLEPVASVAVKERRLEPRRVSGIGPRLSRLEADARAAPFVGRTAELGSLLAAFDAACGSDGQIVGIVGEPGLGKSRLVLELQRALDGRARIVECRCLSYGVAFPYHPLHEIVEAANLEPRADDPSVVKSRTFAALRDHLLELAAERPLVLLVEDMHWIDSTSEEFLATLADDVPSAPILLVATFRPGYAPPWLDRSFAAQLALRPLPDDAASAIVAWVLGAGDEAIVGRGEGNPFFLEELAQATRDRVESVPRTVQDVLAARIDRLSPHAKSTLQVAAVLGREFTPAALTATADDPDATGDALRELKRHEFLRERHGVEGPTFTFKHALTREVAYESLLESRRRELHVRAGTALELQHADALEEHCEQLAHHFALGDDAERAAVYADLANAKATSQHAFEEALAHFDTAMRALDTLPATEANRRRRFSLLLRQVNAFHWLFRQYELYELLVLHEPLVRELDDPDVLGGFHAVMSLVHTSLTRWDDVIAHGDEALRLATDPDVRSLAHTGRGWAFAFLGRHEEALAEYERALAESPRGWHQVYAHGLASLSCVVNGECEEAVRIAEAAIAEARERSDPNTVAFAAVWSTFACLESAQWERAVACAQVGLAAAKTAPVRGSLAALLSSALCHLGSAADSVPVLEQLTLLCKQTNHRLAWTIAAWRLADAYRTIGEADAARTVLEELLAFSTEHGTAYFAAGSRRLLGATAEV